MDAIKTRFANLLTVKSLVTLILSVVFAVLALTHNIDQNFMTIYAVIIAFYFGTQAQKNQTSETLESQTTPIVNNYYLRDGMEVKLPDGGEEARTEIRNL